MRCAIRVITNPICTIDAPYKGIFLMPPFTFLIIESRVPQKCIDAVNNAGNKEGIKPCMDWFLMGEKKEISSPESPIYC